MSHARLSQGVRHSGDPDDLSTEVVVLDSVTRGPCCISSPYLQAVMASTQLSSGMTDQASCHVCRLWCLPPTSVLWHD